MITLLKVIIVMVLSFFNGESGKEVITDNSQYLEHMQFQKTDMLVRCSRTCINS